jgi:hypothetical protein
MPRRTPPAYRFSGCCAGRGISGFSGGRGISGFCGRGISGCGRCGAGVLGLSVIISLYSTQRATRKDYFRNYAFGVPMDGLLKDRLYIVHMRGKHEECERPVCGEGKTDQ